MLGSPILYLKAMRILMFQLSGFYCSSTRAVIKGVVEPPPYRYLGSCVHVCLCRLMHVFIGLRALWLFPSEVYGLRI